VVNLLTQAEETRSKALAQIHNQENALFISHEEVAERQLQTEQQYIQTLSGLRTEYKQLEGAEDKQAVSIAAIEAAAIANEKALETTIKYQKEYAAETERLKAEYKNISAEMGNEATFAESMAKEAERRAMQLERQRDTELAALETRYASIAAEKESGELTEEETAHRDMLTEAINKNYDAIASGLKKAEKEKLNFKDITTQIAQASVSTFTSITSAMSTIAQQQAQEAMAEVDRVLEKTTQRIEEQRNATMEAEGFIEAQWAENMQAQIDAAIEANDEVLQYQLERRKREMEINEEYDAKAKEAEETAKKEKANLEYEAAKSKYEADIANTIITRAMAIANAVNSDMQFGPAAPAMVPVLTALAATTTGTQPAVIKANPPKLKFADGGIVPSQPHANTDTIAAMVMPGEIILNRAQQENLAPQLESRPLVIQLTLDGRIISDTVINDYVNKGIVLIEARRGIR
jgi:hypothetical protein